VFRRVRGKMEALSPGWFRQAHAAEIRLLARGERAQDFDRQSEERGAERGDAYGFNSAVSITVTVGRGGIESMTGLASDFRVG
jgi:hypothetical protein